VSTTFWAIRHAPPVTYVTPAELSDRTVSQAKGTSFTESGYQFDLPWTDIDASPNPPARRNLPGKLIKFRSGLQVWFSTFPKGALANELASSFHSSPELVRSGFDLGRMNSDYEVHKELYEFTPAGMHRWSVDPRLHYRECMTLVIKSVTLPDRASLGIFRIHNEQFQGFQLGTPQTLSSGVSAELFSAAGGVQFYIHQRDVHNSASLTQADINRIVQSLRRVQ